MFCMKISTDAAFPSSGIVNDLVMQSIKEAATGHKDYANVMKCFQTELPYSQLLVTVV